MQFITVLIMNILIGTEVDLFIPSFPELQNVFNLSPFMVELTLGINLLAHCFTSLIVGALGDTYGRKPIILVGLTIFIMGSLFCIFATKYWQLLFGRLLQGIGISSPAVLSYIIIADNYSAKEQQKMIGLLNGSITFAMAFAPVIGSYVDLCFHWQGNFVLLLILGLLSLILSILFIPQNSVKSQIPIFKGLCFKEYYVVCQSPRTIYYISTICFLVLPYWLFIGMAPILYIDDLNVTLSEFGFYQGTAALVFSITSFSSAYCIKKFGYISCLTFSISMLCIFIVGTLSIIILKVSNPMTITICIQFLALGITYPVNILYPLSLESIPNAKSKVAAIITAGRLTLITCIIQVTSYIYNGTFMPIGVGMCLILMVAFWCIYKLFNNFQFSIDLQKYKDII